MKLISEAERESIQKELEMLLDDYNRELNVKVQQEANTVANAKSKLIDLEHELMKPSPREYYEGTPMRFVTILVLSMVN